MKHGIVAGEPGDQKWSRRVREGGLGKGPQGTSPRPYLSRSGRRKAARGQGAISGRVPWLRRADEPAGRQGGRVRILQALSSRGDRAAMDPRAGPGGDARPASALRRCPVLLRLVAHARTPTRAAKRSNDCRPENGPRRRLSSICTGAGRRPSPTPSAAPERSGVNAADIRTRARASPPVNGSAEGRRDASANRPSGRRHAASPRSSVSSRRLYGPHNSGIAGGYNHSVDAATATMTTRSSGRRAPDDCS